MNGKRTVLSCLLILFACSSTVSAGDLIKKDYSDQISGAVKRVIAIDSDNVVNFNFPYEGDTHLTFVAWKTGNKRYIEQGSMYTDVAFSLERGQIVCYEDTCKTRYKMDNGGVHYLKFNTQSKDGSSSTAFVEDRYFLSSLKSAKKLIIEFPVYDNGMQTFVLDASVLSDELSNNLTKQEQKKKHASDIEDAKKDIREISKKLKDPNLTEQQRQDLKLTLELTKGFVSG